MLPIRGIVMRLFPLLIVMMAVFAYLTMHYSILLAFGICYAAGLVIVAILALIGRHRQVDWSWQQTENINSSD